MTITQSRLTTPELKEVTVILFSQLMQVMGFSHTNWLTRLLYLFLKSPAQRMSSMLVELDHNIPRYGWNAAVKIFTSRLVNNVHLQGVENIPSQGPLMVICNHPAAYDVAILAAAIPREDLKILASDIPIVQIFPYISQHIIPVPYHIPSRLQTVRSAIHHLKNDGAIFLFPRGNVEPDPCVSPGAIQSLSGWSPSIELFLRKVPQTCTVVAIASGMLSGRWFKNPLVKLWNKYEQRQKVAEIFQIASQLLTGKPTNVTPMVCFSSPLSLAELGGEGSPQGTLIAGLTAQASDLLSTHPCV
ncbi:MAG: 1-acyl-sn-glycerol-3-phosphate acyltransferase [Anaerolineales bacterium]